MKLILQLQSSNELLKLINSDDWMCRTFLFRLPQPEPRGGARLRTVAVVLRMAAGGVDRARSCGGAVRDAPFDAVADGASRGGSGGGGLVVVRGPSCGMYGACAPPASMAVGGGGACRGGAFPLVAGAAPCA